MLPGADRHGRRFLAAALTGAVVSLLAGVAVAAAVEDVLAVEFRDKSVLAAPVPPAAPPAVVTPLDVAATASLPDGALADPLLRLAAEELATALSERTGLPATVEERFAGASVAAVLDASAELDAEAYQLEPGSGPAAEPSPEPGSGTDAPVTVTGSDRRGLAAGMFRLAQDLRAGHPWHQATAEQLVTPATGRRFVDAGAVGVPIDRAAWQAQDDYSHATGALSQVVLDAEPWVDAEALAEVDAQWRDYVDHVVGYGYNGIVVPGFLEYVTFSGVGDGTDVYPADSAYVARARAMRERIGAMWSYADTMGLDVVLVTDMLALSAPLETYLTDEIGGLDASDERLWRTYAAGLDELFTELPFLDGIMLRIGEAGTVYNLEGWDYYSRLAVTRTAEVRAMLDAFATTAAGHDAEVYFRTWSVGVGDVGDLHTNPETYQRVLGGTARDNLVISTKFVAGDFDSYLPRNPTLSVGEQPRLVEIQARREFEAFSAFPDPVGADHQLALQQVRQSGHLAGVWVWTQSGGPPRAGPLSLYLREGFWQLADLDVWTAARLAWDPDAPVAQLQADWVAATWTTEPAAAEALTALLGQGRQATLDGLYVGPYAERDVRAFGLELPPMMWLFKWDLVSGDTATWSAVHAASAGRVDEAVAQGYSAVDQVAAMQDGLDTVPVTAFRDPATRDALVAALAYQRDMFTVLAVYRETMLRYYDWVDTGSPEAERAHGSALARFESARQAHVERWRDDVDHPPLVFDNAGAGLAVIARDAGVAWSARVSLVAVALALLGSTRVRRAVLVPWRQVDRGPRTGETGWHRVPLVVLALLPVACWVAAHGGVSGFASAAYLATAAGATAAFAAGYLIAVRLAAGSGAVGPALSALAGATALSTLPLLVALALRGTTTAWSGFWLDADGRSAFLVAHVAGLVWAGGVLAVSASRWAPTRARAAAAAGSTLAGAGMAAGVVGAVMGSVGLERYLTTLNDAMAIIPFGLSRILGITGHLGIPAALPGTLLVGGLAAAALVLLAGAVARRVSSAACHLSSGHAADA